MMVDGVLFEGDGWYCSKTAERGAVMSIHLAPSGKKGATISWWRLPPEKMLPCWITSSTSGGKKGEGWSVMPMTIKLFMTVGNKKNLHVSSRP